MIFKPNILVGYLDGLLSLGPLGGWGHNLKNVCTIQHSWFYPDIFAKHLGELSSLICCLWAKHTIAKTCKQFNILDFILIFVPNSWGSYQVRLLFLGPEGGGIAQILKCLYTSTFFILSWFCANNLGKCSTWIVVCEPCGEGHNF